MNHMHRRRFVMGISAVIAALGVAPRAGARCAHWMASRAEPPRADPVEALVALSRDDTGAAHIERAAVLTVDAIVGTLRLTSREASDLRSAFAAGDFEPLQRAGISVAGQRFVLVRDLVRDGEDAQMLHAVSPRAFITARASGSQLVVALASKGMAHGRAVEAVYRYMRLGHPTA